MCNPLIAKLEHGADLTEADCAVFTDLTRHSYRVGARQDIIREGERPEVVHLVLEGTACRYKMLSGDARQNTALLLPGDLSITNVAFLNTFDHSIATLSACTLVAIPRRAILDLADRHPSIARALWWCAIAEESTLRQ